MFDKSTIFLLLLLLDTTIFQILKIYFNKNIALFDVELFSSYNKSLLHNSDL